MLDVRSTLLASGASKLIAALAFAWVAYRLAGRRVSPGARSANSGFVIFWASLGATSAIASALDTSAALGASTPAPWIVARYATMLLFCAGFAGLVHYVGYVYVGDRWKPAPVVAAYAILYAILATIVASSRPSGVALRPWRSDVSYASEPSAPLFAFAAILLLAPPLLASLAYARLHVRLEDPEQRRRARLVSVALVAWFAALLASTLSQDPLAQFVARPFAGIVVGVLVVVAHSPRGRFFNPPEPGRRRAIERRAKELV